MENELIELTKPRRRRSHRRAKRILSAILAAAIVAIISFFQVAPEPAQQAVLDNQPGLWLVTKAVDGDTLTVQLGDQTDTVRLLGVDTPETHDPRKPVQCFGQAASDYTRSLVEGKHVRLEPDPTNSDRDKYKRLLRYVYLPDGTLVNAKLISDGYAFAYTIFPLTKLDEFRDLQTAAREQNRGLWAGCSVDDSKDILQTTGNK